MARVIKANILCFFRYFLMVSEDASGENFSDFGEAFFVAHEVGRDGGLGGDHRADAMKY